MTPDQLQIVNHVRALPDRHHKQPHTWFGVFRYGVGFGVLWTNTALIPGPPLWQTVMMVLLAGMVLAAPRMLRDTGWTCWRRGAHELHVIMEKGPHDGAPIEWLPDDGGVLDHIIMKAAHWRGSEELIEAVRHYGEEHGLSILYAGCGVCDCADRRGDVVAQRIVEHRPIFTLWRW